MCLVKTPKVKSDPNVDKPLPVIRNPILDGLLGNIAALRNGRNGLRIDRINPLTIPPGVGNTVGGGNSIGGGTGSGGSLSGGGSGTTDTLSGGGGLAGGGGGGGFGGGGGGRTLVQRY